MTKGHGGPQHHKRGDAEGGGGGGGGREDLGLPRMIARVWGLIAGISFVSNGGYLLVEMTEQPKCQGAGGYMIIFGLILIIQECACCLCPVKDNCCDKFEDAVPFWARSIFYILVVIPPLGLCFGVKTVISSLIVIMQGIIYAFLYCLVRSNKYERLREASRVEMKRRQNEAMGYGTIMSTANNAMNFIKDTTAASKQHASRPKHAAAAGGKPKRGKPRAGTALA